MDTRKARDECELRGTSHTSIYPKNCKLQLRKQTGRIQRTERTLISSLKRNLQMSGYGIFARVCACVRACVNVFRSSVLLA